MLQSHLFYLFRRPRNALKILLSCAKMSWDYDTICPAAENSSSFRYDFVQTAVKLVRKVG